MRVVNDDVEQEEQKIEAPIVIRPDDFIVQAFSPRVNAELQLQESFSDSNDSVSEPDLLMDDDLEEEFKDNVS